MLLLTTTPAVAGARPSGADGALRSPPLTPFLRCESRSLRHLRNLQDRQRLFDPRPGGLQPGRHDERLAKMRRIFVGRKAWSVGGQLEEHAAGFAEVHRLEPEPVDHRRGADASLL